MDVIIPCSVGRRGGAGFTFWTGGGGFTFGITVAAEVDGSFGIGGGDASLAVVPWVALSAGG